MEIDTEFVLGIISATLGLVIFSFIFVFLFYPLIKQYFNAKNLAEFQDGYMFKAGGRFDLYNTTFPFVNIKLNNMAIEIKSLDCFIKLYYEQIISAEYYQGLFSNGVEIKHTKQDIPQIIIIWTPYYYQLINFINSKKSIVL